MNVVRNIGSIAIALNGCYHQSTSLLY